MRGRARRCCGCRVRYTLRRGCRNFLMAPVHYCVDARFNETNAVAECCAAEITKNHQVHICVSHSQCAVRACDETSVREWCAVHALSCSFCHRGRKAGCGGCAKRARCMPLEATSRPDHACPGRRVRSCVRLFFCLRLMIGHCETTSSTHRKIKIYLYTFVHGVRTEAQHSDVSAVALTRFCELPSITLKMLSVAACRLTAEIHAYSSTWSAPATHGEFHECLHVFGQLFTQHRFFSIQLSP